MVKPLNTDSLREAMQRMRELAKGDEPMFIKPTHAIVPASWLVCTGCGEPLGSWGYCDVCDDNTGDL